MLWCRFLLLFNITLSATDESRWRKIEQVNFLIVTFVSFLVFSTVKKVAQYMADVLEDSKDKVQENLLANGGKC